MPTKRAVIYVRVSSERQADDDKTSPITQEQDCRDLCERQGYEVLKIYRDIEKYRVRGRLTEPSGSRADRPGYKQMLEDARAGHFDIIIGWREDRLYRGFRPMIDMADTLDATSVTVELARETFDPRMMGLKASIAKLELDAIKERTSMGRAARLATGKLNTNNPIYGLTYNPASGGLVVNETEAHWVRQIWQWYAKGVSVGSIRHRLIDACAPQSKTALVPRKHSWSLSVIGVILRRDSYFTGVFVTKWNGKEYEANIPTLIDADTYHAVVARRATYKAYPAGNLRSSALVAGHVYCAACGTVMSVTSSVRHRRQGIVRDVYYRCHSYARLTPMQGCAGFYRQDAMDAIVWDRVWASISVPERFEQLLKERLTLLQSEDIDTEGDIAKMERQLDNVLLERQRIVGFAAKGIINEDDLATHIMTLTMQERSIRKELAEKSLLTGNRVERLLEMASLYRKKIQAGMSALNAEPQSGELAAKQFEFRRKIVEGLATRVQVNPDKSVSVDGSFSFLAMAPLVSITHIQSCHNIDDRHQLFQVALTL